MSVPIPYIYQRLLTFMKNGERQAYGKDAFRARMSRGFKLRKEDVKYILKDFKEMGLLKIGRSTIELEGGRHKW